MAEERAAELCCKIHVVASGHWVLPLTRRDFEQSAINVIRAAERSAEDRVREACCKVVCPLCKQQIPVKVLSAEPRWFHEMAEQENHWREYEDCEAAAIRAMPRKEEERSDDE
jgi:hypothetical protein